ncbi:MAG: hypothetical protein ACK5U7_13480 [Bacteroidota bacterium]
MEQKKAELLASVGAIEIIEAAPETATAKPKAETATAKPKAETATAKPKAETATAKPKAETATAKPHRKRYPCTAASSTQFSPRPLTSVCRTAKTICV